MTNETDRAPAQRTVPAMLKRQADRFGEKPCLEIGRTHWLHRDAPRAAARAGAALRRAGVGKGDRVALMSSNRVECLEVFLGCGWIGAISVPINSASMGPQIEYFLADSGARLLVIEAALADRLGTADLARTRVESLWLIGAEEGDAATGALPAGLRIAPFPKATEGAEEADAVFFFNV